MMFRRFAFLLVAVALLAGCNNEKTRNLIDRRSDQAIRMSEEAQAPAPKKSFNPLTVTDKVWAGNAAMRLRRGLPLPSKYEGNRGVALISSEPMSLSDIALSVGAQTGIPVRVAQGSAAGGNQPVQQPIMMPGMSGMPGADDSAGSSGGMPISYEGPLSGLLDLVAGHFGLSWKYDGASVNFSRFETRVFVVEALPGTQTVKDGIKDSDDSSSSSSSSTAAGGASYSVSSTNSLSQSSEMNVEMKVWDELAATITGMLGGVGSVVAAPSSGTVTVTTTPELMRVVAKFMEEENKRLSNQIAINVEIYSVALEEGTDFSMTFREALRRLTNFGLNYQGASGPTATAASTFASGGVPIYNMADGTAGPLTGLATGITTGSIEGGGNLAVAILDPTKVGQISGLFSALSTIGDTTRVAQFPMTTLNNRTVSRRIGRDRTYVASISNSTSTESSFASSTVTPGTIREGFSLQLTPRMLDDGRIMLQYSMSLTDIVGKIETIDTGVGKIQLPQTASRVFVQQAMIKSGSTLIVGGYDDEQASQQSQGVGSPFNYFLGGGSSNSKSRAMLFIAITPQVLDPRGGEERG